MPPGDASKIRSLLLVSHQGAGKTSLAEAFLFNAKAIPRLGQVASGSTTSDYNPDEFEHHMSISAKPLHWDWKGHRFYLIDTPGYLDFSGEVSSAVRAVDGAVLVVDAGAGVEVGTERVWDLLEEAGLPRLIFINKMEKDNADYFRTLGELRERFGKRCVPVDVPKGQQGGFAGAISLIDEKAAFPEDLKEREEKLKELLIESVAETDDVLLEKYLAGQPIPIEEEIKDLRMDTIDGKLVPVLCGSALKNLGVEELLDAAVEYLPSPKERAPAAGADPKTKGRQTRPCDPAAPFSALVFKTISDPYVGQLTCFRVFSGTLAANSGFFNASKQAREHIGPLYLLQGKAQIAAPQLSAGEIGACAKLKDTSTGDTLCDEKSPILFPAIELPEACLSASVKPHTKQDDEKILPALQRIAAEDPTFRFTRDAQTKELLISGIGDIHLEVVVNRLRKKYNVQVDLGTPKVPYKETVRGRAKVQGKHKKQTGGHGQFGDCWIEIEPLPHGTGFEFVDKVVGGAIPRQFIPSVEKGVREAMQSGCLAGFPVVDFRVTLFDGSHHPVDSSDMAFQIAGSLAFKKAEEEAQPTLLEPIMEVEVTIPDELMGQATGDLNGRRGRILGVENRGRNAVVKASVPLAELFRYAGELRSMTGGRGFYHMKFSRYEEVPGKIQQQVIEQAKHHVEAGKV